MKNPETFLSKELERISNIILKHKLVFIVKSVKQTYVWGDECY